MNPKYIDVHAHINFAAYDADREEVIRRTLEGDTYVVNVGTQHDTSAYAVELAEKHDGFFAAVGLHPIHTAKSYHDKNEIGDGGEEFTSRGEVFDSAYYRQLAEGKKVVAIGECGLDYYRLEADTKEKQRNIFIQQIELANELKKPLMLHVRNAYRDAHEILKAHLKTTGNMHFFAGSMEEARKFLDLGLYCSFTGVITFARNYDECVKHIPLDRILAETDSPYVAPAPYRGRRNEPSYVGEVYKAIAQIRGEDPEIVRSTLVSNAMKIFGLSGLQ